MRRRCGMKIIFIGWCILGPAYSACFAASGAEKSVKEANMLYRRGKLDQALQKYGEAGVALPDSDIVNFNIGAVWYKKEDYQKAADSFSKALTSMDKKVEADALYNLGNCKYKLGKLKESADLSSAVGLLRESLDYYKRAVEVDQKNDDARFNHEFVERELKVLQDKLKQQGPDKNKQKGPQEQKQGNQDAPSVNKEQGVSEKEKKEAAQAQGQQQQEKEGESREGQPRQEEKPQEEKQASAEESLQEGGNKELSEEGARALLERYGRDEAAPDYADKETRKDYDSEALKDW